MKIPALFKVTCQCCGKSEYTFHLLNAMSHICKYCSWEHDSFIDTDDEESDVNQSLSLKDYRYINCIGDKIGITEDTGFLTPYWWYNRPSWFNKLFSFAR